jgi:hypothetical protein
MNTSRGISSRSVQLFIKHRTGRPSLTTLSDTLLLKTHADEYRWAEPDAYSEFVPVPLHLVRPNGYLVSNADSLLATRTRPPKAYDDFLNNVFTKEVTRQ